MDTGVPNEHQHSLKLTLIHTTSTMAPIFICLYHHYKGFCSANMQRSISWENSRRRALFVTETTPTTQEQQRYVRASTGSNREYQNDRNCSDGHYITNDEWQMNVSCIFMPSMPMVVASQNDAKVFIDIDRHAISSQTMPMKNNGRYYHHYYLPTRIC